MIRIITGLCTTVMLNIAFNESYGQESVTLNSSSSNEARATVPAAQALQAHLNKLQQIEMNGGWNTITLRKKFYQQYQKDPVVIQIKKRLIASGELQDTSLSSEFTPELTEAVKKAQKTYGLTENGVVDAALIKQLNVPVSKRIAQLQMNIGRMYDLQAPASGTWLVANIPEFKLHVYENGLEQFSMPIVVGSETNQTVIFNDEMQQIVFSPYWNVPESIVINEIMPAMMDNPSYLRKNNYEQTGTQNGIPVIRQKPGPSNSLGEVKFLFPNSHNIYFHDTPAKSLFSLKKRAFSHGCIRLAQPAKLAQYLLRNAPGWDAAKIKAAMESRKEQYVNLPTKVPVSITYLTAWVGGDGQLNFRDDIYGMD